MSLFLGLSARPENLAGSWACAAIFGSDRGEPENHFEFWGRILGRFSSARPKPVFSLPAGFSCFRLLVVSN